MENYKVHTRRFKNFLNEEAPQYGYDEWDEPITRKKMVERAMYNCLLIVLDRLADPRTMDQYVKGFLRDSDAMNHDYPSQARLAGTATPAEIQYISRFISSTLGRVRDEVEADVGYVDEYKRDVRRYEPRW